MAIIRRTTRLVNIRDTDAHYDVYIGRGSSWGNPFRIGKDGSRKEVIRLYKQWLDRWILYKKEIIINGLSNKWIVERLKRLKGKVLGCYCWPLPCHGDVLIVLVKELL